MPSLPVIALHNVVSKRFCIPMKDFTNHKPYKRLPLTALLAFGLGATSYVHADSMSALITQKAAQPNLAAPSARISNNLTIRRASAPADSYSSPTLTTQNLSNTYRYPSTETTATTESAYRAANSYRPSETYRSGQSYSYPEVQRQTPALLPAFLSGSYDNVDSEYLPLLSAAETQSSTAAQEVISMARKMALNERTIIQGGCWDYLNEVFKRAGVSRDTVHKGAYRQGPYANSQEIKVGDWLYYINHGYRGIEHSGLFVGWVDESAKQALILSYAGESRREPARYKVYDLSNVYQIMRPTI